MNVTQFEDFLQCRKLWHPCIMWWTVQVLADLGDPLWCLWHRTRIKSQTNVKPQLIHQSDTVLSCVSEARQPWPMWPCSGPNCRAVGLPVDVPDVWQALPQQRIAAAAHPGVPLQYVQLSLPGMWPDIPQPRLPGPPQDSQGSGRRVLHVCWELPQWWGAGDTPLHLSSQLQRDAMCLVWQAVQYPLQPESSCGVHPS